MGFFFRRNRACRSTSLKYSFSGSRRFTPTCSPRYFAIWQENDPTQEWVAVAIFRTRKEEPKHLGPYEDLLQSKHVKRIYLEHYVNSENPPLGLGVLQLLFASQSEAQLITPRIVQKA